MTERRQNPERIVIEAIRPSIDGGRHAVKAIAGDTLSVEATVFRHGHERLRVVLLWRDPDHRAFRESPMTLVTPGRDRWRGEIRLDRLGRHRFTIAAWTDRYASWVEGLTTRLDAGSPDVASEIAEGLALVERVFDGLRDDRRHEVGRFLARLSTLASQPADLLAAASTEEALALMTSVATREDEVRFEPGQVVVVERARARAGAWYEMFVRSQGTEAGRSGTFRDAQRRLADLNAMGFDVVYLAPIHPIGRTGRKGRNNLTEAGPQDPGSPWAIGNEDGGHTAIDPALGTLEDFDRFRRAAEALGMEVALDFAAQCSPDHPWVREHPDWFRRRPDGTIRYAENPPKRYEDIYPLDFDTADREPLWEALRGVVRFWIGRGVRMFRVDNPHTKPIGFWSWLIESIQADHPEVIFLAEAFTRPPMMQALAKRGFSQSYTYFTWRNTKQELVEYLTELTRPEMSWYFRPNFFVNTPDILPPVLQHGGPAAFKSRLVLAATLAPSYGIYSGFELCEHAALPGREEYLDSEKYEIKVRRWDAPGDIVEFISCVNRTRREHQALQQFTNLRFLDIDDDQLLAYVKWSDEGDRVIVVVNLDPSATHAATLQIPPDAIGAPAGLTFDVDDVLTGERFTWGARNVVRLDPVAGEPARILRVSRFEPAGPSGLVQLPRRLDDVDEPLQDVPTAKFPS